MRRIKKVIFKMYQTVFYVLGIILPKNKKIIIFESFLGKQYSDNPRAIYEYLKEKYPDFKMYWSVERRSIHKFQHLDVKSIRRFSLKWLYLMNRAKYWFINSRLPLWIPKPKNTIYVQTWHGTPLKKLALDMEEVHMPGTNTERYKRNFIRDSSKWDYLISPNEYSTTIFKRAFAFHKTIIESGYPRNDFLINANDKAVQEIKEKLNIPLDKKVILYAPTWRDNEYYSVGRYKFEIPFNIEEVKASIEDDYVLLFRLHYLVSENLDLSEYEGFIYDFSGHEDIRDLFVISDLLITDYSSVFFDYAILRRPMLFYVYDIEKYRDELRGFYFDFEREAPGPLLKTTPELIKAIKNAESYLDEKKMKEFHKRFCSLEDGYATERVVNHIFKSH